MVLVFDIETVPDVVTGRVLYNLHGLSDEDTAKAMFSLRRNKVGHDFLPHHLQKIIAISLVMARPDGSVKIWSLGEEHSEESELIQRFFHGLDSYIPTIVSWNGSGFDLPVLHYRALLHNIQAPNYWELGECKQEFRWNNYLNRFHTRHLDLMDVLAGYQNKAFAPLDEIATMLGFPGKMGMDGSRVWSEYLKGNLVGIRNYCETDVLNTYCVYLRFEQMRGILSRETYQAHLQMLSKSLSEAPEPHLQDFALNLISFS